jgi:hypothetical protein
VGPLLVGLLVVTSAFVLLPPGSASASRSVWVNVEPGDVTHGETEQSMDVLVEEPPDDFAFVVNVSSLADAGVDLTNASVDVDQPEDATVNATLTRVDGDVLVRVELDTDDTPGDLRFEMTLTGMATENASHTRLSYDVQYGDQRRGTRTFDLRNPDLPWVSTLTRADRLLSGERNASQRVRVVLDDVPATDAAMVRVDLSALTDRGVSLSAATVDATPVEPDRNGRLRDVELDGDTVVFTLGTAEETDFTIEFWLRGLDTRGADPADRLRHAVTFEGDAGTVAGMTEPFGLYAPGDTPTPTATPTGPLTTTPSPTPTPSETPGETTPTASETSRDVMTDDTGTAGTAPGFSVLSGLIAALLAVVLIHRRIR